MSGENNGDKRRYMDAKDFRYISEPKVVVDKGLAEDRVQNVGGGSSENYARVIDPNEIAGVINAEERLAEEMEKIGGGSPEVHARGFEAPTSEQVYEAEANNKHRDEMLRQDAAEDKRPKGVVSWVKKIFNPSKLR